MRVAKIFVQDKWAGVLEELSRKHYRFTYNGDYQGLPVSLTMPIRKEAYSYDSFPPFFEGLLPEGAQLQALLKREKVDEDDLFGQLLLVGGDLVGAVNVEQTK